MEPIKTHRNEPIALIGSGCRFPGGANSPSRLWGLLKSPKDLVKKVPRERFNIDGYYHPDGGHHGRTNARYGYFLEEDPYAFDPAFFNISPNEVEMIDPQQRMLLETVYDSLVSAGLKMEDLKGTPTAIYVGLMQRDFLDNSNYDMDALSTYAATGSAASILSNRVSYAFGWHGPSETLDTACSSSLVAVHHAVQQLRTGASEVAVAAGSNLILGPTPFITASKVNMFSPTGRCRMWDAGADGYARGEGVAAVVLKTLSRAIADGDTIECVIRESGVNQDGKTPGITMPSPTAQEALIRQVYKEAGLDISKPEDRCQYFEAHGTGTPAGDPQEACAISSAFFGGRQRAEDEDPLYVGSIKTIIGHTEGTAGVAGLLKASQAIQHGILPPNLLFQELSPRVAPFYSDLQVVTEAQTWPALKLNQPRRVSVNSFGFGGTNVHVIVESYSPTSMPALDRPATACLAPIVLSANSYVALKATMDDLRQSLRSQPDLQLQNLAWTLMNKRSNLQSRHSIQAKTISSLCDILEHDAPLVVQGKPSIAVASDTRAKPQILGIFTGQGAQWPTMGRQLITEIPYARRIITELDQSLQDLPTKYKPEWRLLDQLLLEGEDSNVHDSAFSQPLCCAVQLMLIKLLEASGVSFKAVIGHSSGEIACAFTAGFISASNAIRIAYLRGLISAYAGGPNGVEGAMIAAGTSFDDATDLCALEAFEGRVTVAASNAPQSVTLSGDKDAILEVQQILTDESRFARVLKVDKAYHSHHMKPCAEPYVAALKACGCDTVDSDMKPKATWISSVHDGRLMQPSQLSAEYWVENLLSPVLFSFAVEMAVVKQTPVDLCIEVGAHPALKNPTLQTMQNCTGSDAPLPYVGCMERNKDDTDAFSSCLGYIWSHFGSPAVDIDKLYTTLAISDARDVSKQLPSYSWDHSKSYRKESRTVKRLLEAERPHLLLGRLSAHSTPSAMHWQNFIRPRDIPWLDGHSLQGQVVFPGAGYVVMALEAAVKLGGERTIQLLEVLDLRIHKAVTFEDENSMVEMTLAVDNDASQTTEAYAMYSFAISSCLARETGLTKSVSGTLAVTYGPQIEDALPPPTGEPAHLGDDGVDRFYDMLDRVGYNYTGLFRGITHLKRGDSKAFGTMNFDRLEDGDREMIFHPSTLDVAFQGMIAAYAGAGENKISSLLVPTEIGRIALNPLVANRVNDHVDFTSTSVLAAATGIQGDIEVFDSETDATLLHIEGIGFKPTIPPSAADDHHMYTQWRMGPLEPDALFDEVDRHATDKDKQEVAVIERVTYWYIRLIMSETTARDREEASFTFSKYIQWCEHVLDEIQAGRNPWYTSDWDKDTQADIDAMIEANTASPLMRLIQRVGENAVETLRNNENAFDLLDNDGLLTELYGGEHSYGQSYHYYKRMLEQVNHRYPNMNILEVGAGTAGASRLVLNNDRLTFNSYTFTDISSHFFEAASKEFERHANKMHFRPLDIRRSPAEQGFEPNSYDLIAASNVLHATPNLGESLANARSLLKPGGRLIVIEIAHKQQARLGFIFGLFPDWWSGHDEGRVLGPSITYDEWDKVLKKSGFAGVESRSLDPDSVTFPSGVFLSRAMDDNIQKLDSPLEASLENPSSGDFVVVGGSTPPSLEFINKVGNFLPAGRKWSTVPTLREAINFDLYPGTTFIMLSELDEHTFEGLDEEKFDALQTIFNAARHVLWLTERAWTENAQQAMTIGLLRSLRLEYPDVQIQVLDVDSVGNLEAHFLVETVLRLEHGAKWEDNGLLWTQEPELYLIGGKVMIPRLKRDVARNNRLNSGRRTILADLDPRKNNLSMVYEGENPFYKSDIGDFDPSYPDKDLVHIHVHYSLPKALRIGRFGFFHLVQGNIAGTGSTVVALSERNASHIQVPLDQIIHLTKGDAVAKSLLLGISANIIGATLISDLTPGSTVVVYEPPRSFVESLRDHAAAAGAKLTIASTQSELKATGIVYIRLHERETERNLRRKLPRDTTTFYDFVADQNPASLSQRLLMYLPATCLTHGPNYLFRNIATPDSSANGKNAAQVLARALKTARNGCILDPATFVTCSDVAASRTVPTMDSIIDWTADERVTSRIQPIEANCRFSADKTYLLAGLAGDMGRSLARFMVGNGARHIVLSSRVPQIDQRWIDDITNSGGNVLVHPMDLSSEASVDKGLAEIKALMPPIGGVAFGPLLLADVMFKNMELSALEMVLAPKVNGARLLNDRLSDPANPLDFFVMFSSIVLVVGNPGQAAYSAANAYINAIARQRRARGLAGSTIDIGAVLGVGFIHRAGRENEAQTRKFLADEVKEGELYALFTEAVVAGRNGEPDDIELVTGMTYLDEKLRDRIPWFDDPRFAEFQRSERQTAGNDGAKNVVSLKEQLSRAESLDEAHAIILDGVSTRIRGALLFAEGQELNLTAPLIDQGVDSLSAVTVVSWFSKNLNLDIPLLKILGGASASQLVDDAASRLSPELIPLVDPASLTGKMLEESSPTAPASTTGTATDGTASSVEYNGNIQTPPSHPFSEAGDGFERTGPLSIVQEYSWKEMQLPLDPSTFNTTIGMYMQGPLDFGRLSWAFGQALQRHDAFRACFISDPESSAAQPTQLVMKSPRNAFQAIKVADRNAADDAFKELQNAKYDLDKGDTLKIVNYFWTPTDHLLTIAYHRLAGDGWTTEHFFFEVSMLYSGLPLEPPPSYVDYAVRQRTELASGAFDADLSYWSGLFLTLPVHLPVLSLAPEHIRGSVSSTALDWSCYEFETRLSRMLAVRIKDRSRKQQATPMHFYLACFNILLARMAGISDITIGVADAGRASLLDQATMGYFASYLPVRIAYDPGHVFNEALCNTKEQMRAALLHSAVPLPAILDRLGLPSTTCAEDKSSQAPLFQAIFDYKQGQTESGSIGEAKMIDSIIPRAGTPYDITLQMGDDPSKGEPIVTVKVRKEKYGSCAAEAVMQAYVSIVTTFSRNPVLRVTDTALE